MTARIRCDVDEVLREIQERELRDVETVRRVVGADRISGPRFVAAWVALVGACLFVWAAVIRYAPLFLR